MSTSAGKIQSEERKLLRELIERTPSKDLLNQTVHEGFMKLDAKKAGSRQVNLRRPPHALGLGAASKPIAMERAQRAELLRKASKEYAQDEVVEKRIAPALAESALACTPIPPKKRSRLQQMVKLYLYFIHSHTHIYIYIYIYSHKYIERKSERIGI